MVGRRQGDRRPTDPGAANRRGRRLPEKLALVGFALIGFWPGEPWSATQVTLVVMCLLPLGVRSLLQWEDLLEAEPPPPPVTREEAVARSVHALDNVAVPLAIIEASPDGGVVREANPTMVDLLGLDPTGRFWWYLVAPADRVAVARAITMILGGHSRAWRGLARHLPAPDEPDQAAAWLRLQLIALPVRRGEPARLSLQATPAAAPPRLSRPVQAPAPTDPVAAPRPAAVVAGLPDLADLTGLLTALHEPQDRPATGLVVVHCSVDVGRPTTTQATEAVLAAVATRLLDTCRTGDLVVRGDGDSLVVARPGVPPADLETDAEQLQRRLVAALAAPLAVQDVVRTVPVRLGTARGGPDDDPTQLLRTAALRAATTVS